MGHDLLGVLKEKMPSFSKGRRVLTSYILSNYGEAAHMTAAALGKASGVSESTVVRFAKELGFRDYREMRDALLEIVKSKLTSVERMEMTDLLIGDSDILERVLNSDAEKIRLTLDEIDREAFYGAIDEIVSGKNIYILGVRSSSSLASFMYLNFKLIFDNVKLIRTTSRSEILEELFTVGPDDVVIAISFPRYSKRIVDAVQFARTRNADIIALTDGENSPIAPYAAQLLTARSDMASFVDSLVAPLSIINAMFVALAHKKKTELASRLRGFETIWKEHEVYDG